MARWWGDVRPRRADLRAEGLRRTGRVDVTGPVRLYEASPVVGSSTEQAYDAATTWAVGHAREHP